MGSDGGARPGKVGCTLSTGIAHSRRYRRSEVRRAVLAFTVGAVQRHRETRVRVPRGGRCSPSPSAPCAFFLILMVGSDGGARPGKVGCTLSTGIAHSQRYRRSEVRRAVLAFTVGAVQRHRETLSSECRATGGARPHRQGRAPAARNRPQRRRRHRASPRQRESPPAKCATAPRRETASQPRVARVESADIPVLATARPTRICPARPTLRGRTRARLRQPAPRAILSRAQRRRGRLVQLEMRDIRESPSPACAQPSELE
jgi:hypothetical protein